MGLDFTAETLTKPHVLLLMLSVALMVGYVYYRYIYAPYQVFRLIGVEGPVPQPFWGNVLEYKRMGEEKMFEHLYTNYGGISGFYLGNQPYLLVADMKLLKELMVNATEHFRTSNEDNGGRIHGLPPSLLPSAYKGKEWQQIRNTIVSAFVPSKLVMMSPLVEDNTRAFLEILGDATSKESTNVWSLYCSFALEVLCSQLCDNANVQRVEKSDLKKAVQSFFNTTTSQKPSETSTTAARRWKNIGRKARSQAKVEAVKKAVSKLVQKHQQLYNQRQQERQKLVKQRSLSLLQLQTNPQAKAKAKCQLPKQPSVDTAAKRKGFLQLLVEGSRSRNLTEEEMISCCVTFLLSGYETIASALAHTSYLLALNLEVQDELCRTIDSYIKANPVLYEAAEEVTYLNMIVQESLRLYPPTSKIVLSCMETCIVKGVTIPKEAKVVIPISLIHRNHELWAQPDKFLPDRFSRNPSGFCHIPFGEGPQSCVGMKFALMAVKLILIAVLEKYKFAKAPETEVPLESIEGVPTRRPVNGLYLKIRNRRH